MRFLGFDVITKSLATSLATGVVSGLLATVGMNPAEAATAFLGSTNGNFGTVDTGTGAFTPIGTTESFFDIAVASPTLGYGVTSNRNFYSINLANASTNFIGNTGAFMNGLGFDNSGNLFGTGSNNFFSIDLSTGFASLVATINQFTSSGDIAFDGDKFFATSTSPNGDTLFSFKTDGTSQTVIGPIGFSGVYGLTYQEGTLFGYTNANEVLAINTANGSGAVIASINGLSGGVNGAGPTAVPEPLTILGSAAALGFGALFKKRQKT